MYSATEHFFKDNFYCKIYYKPTRIYTSTDFMKRLVAERHPDIYFKKLILYESVNQNDLRASYMKIRNHGL
jgi:hypothetical protein